MATRTRPRTRWETRLEADFSQGMFRDIDRTSIPPGGCYNAIDLLLHRPGKAFKRGGTTYASDALGSDTYAMTVAYANFLAGAQLVAVGSTGISSTGALYKIAANGGVTNMGGTIPYMVDRPRFFLGGAQSILVFPGLGSTYPIYYDGANVPQTFPGGATDVTTGVQVASQYTLTISGTPTGGNFKLDLTVQSDPVAGGGTGLPGTYGFRTGNIAYNASAANVKTAIDAALAPLGLTSSTGGGSLPGTPVTIDLPLGVSVSYVPAAVSGVSLTGGTNPNGKITNTTTTSSAIDTISVPKGRFCWTFNNRLVLANSVDNQNRVWYSPLVDVTHSGWDLATAWLDMDENVSGGTYLSGQQIVFSANGFWRIIGTTPPPGSDFEVERIADIGCTDARSILVYEGQCIFANPRGVWVTTGVAPVNLMNDRIASYWRGILDGYTPSADNNAEWCITTGLYAGRFLFVSVLNADGTFVDGFICDMTNRAWSRQTNFRFRNYAMATGIDEELYAASRATNRVVALSGVYAPASGNKNDADGTAVTWTLETRALGEGIGVKAFGDSELLYDVRDAASDNPTVAVSVAPGVEATSFSTVAESPLAETTDLDRKRFTVSKDSECVTVKLVQSNASSKSEIYGVEWNQRRYGPWADGE